jgi:hypothetical protein
MYFDTVVVQYSTPSPISVKTPHSPTKYINTTFLKKQQNSNRIAALWKGQLLKTAAVHEAAELIQMAFAQHVCDS